MAMEPDRSARRTFDHQNTGTSYEEHGPHGKIWHENLWGGKELEVKDE